MRLLILGGTAEARELAGKLVGDDTIQPILSLAGRTLDPLDQGVPVRTGGFGGIDGLAQFLTTEKIDAVIDATHPFAVQMSRHARAGCQKLGTPILHVERPQWIPEGRETWIRVSDIQAAVDALPTGARAFSATGRGTLENFVARKDIYSCLRVIDPQPAVFPGNGEFVVARPPFTVAAEEKVLKSHRATHLVVKNAGGVAGRTKLTAAGNLGLPIIIVDRVPLPNGSVTVQDAQSALAWVKSWPDFTLT